MRERGDKKKSLQPNRDAFPLPIKQFLQLNLNRAYGQRCDKIQNGKFDLKKRSFFTFLWFSRNVFG